MNLNNNSETEIVDILKRIYLGKKLIVTITLIFFVVGILFSLLSPIKYSSHTVFIPQNQETNSSSLSGVASLVGINLGSGVSGGEIPASMYPEIGDSPKFKRLILEKVIDKKRNLKLKNFIIDYYKLKDDNIHNSSSPMFVSELDQKCFNILNKMISIRANVKDGFVTIVGIMPIAEYSAVLASNSKEILQKIIIENKIERAKQNLKFSQERLNEKKIEFDLIQSKLSYFKDSNLNLVNSAIIYEQGKLEAEFQIINAVVTELSKQVEQAKLQVTKDTPVFSTIREAVIPNQRTSPKRTQLVLIFSIFGFIISTLLTIIIQPVKKLFLEINS